MKIIQINAVCEFGSTGKICVEIAEYLKSRGDKCKIFYGNGHSSYSDSVCMTLPWQVKYHALMSRITGLEGHFSKSATKKFIKYVDKYKPDLVHIHNVHGNYVHLPFLLTELSIRKIPVVITLHDCWFFTGKCSHFIYADCNKWQNGCGNCPQLKNDIPSLIFDKTKYLLKEKSRLFDLQKSITFIAVSDWIAECAKKSILRHHQIDTIYNWVDTNAFYPLDVDNENKFVVLGVSAIWDKNSQKMKDFIELAIKLGNEYQVRLIGSFTSSDISLPENMEIVKYIKSDADLAKEYSKADVYVHLSYGDSFGKVLVEALSCGTPVVCYDNTACSEIVASGCGYKVETGKVEDVLEAIKHIQLQGKDAYSKNCLQQCKKYDKKTMLEKTAHLYEKLILKGDTE